MDAQWGILNPLLPGRGKRGQAPHGAGKKRPRRERVMGNRLVVSNLSFNTSMASIEAAFAEAGVVREVAMPTDRETGQTRAFAFVTMGSAQAASDAIRMLDGSKLDGRTIRVNEAQERKGGAITNKGRGARQVF